MNEIVKSELIISARNAKPLSCSFPDWESMSVFVSIKYSVPTPDDFWLHIPSSFPLLP